MAGFPNERVSNETPPNAIDGSTATFTWTTESFNTDDPSHIAVDFASTAVNMLRLWKTNETGATPTTEPKNLTISYTTGVGALSGRTWTTVTGLTNGHNGIELIDATTVNLAGTVTGDNHDSPGGDGWAYGLPVRPESAGRAGLLR